MQLFDNRRGYAKRCAKHIEKTLSQYDELIVHVTKKAMEVTEVAVKAQDEERKKMMVAIRYAGHKCLFSCHIVGEEVNNRIWIFLRLTIFWRYWVITKLPLRGKCSIVSLRIPPRPF